MSAAFEDVCKALDLADDAGGPRELIASQIVGVAHLGERSPTALRDRVLREFTAFDARGVMQLVRPTSAILSKAWYGFELVHPRAGQLPLELPLPIAMVYAAVGQKRRRSQ